MTIRLTVLALPVALVALAGCSVIPGAQPIADQARVQAEGTMDDLVDFNLWQLCYGFNVGAVRREFGTSQERAALYHQLCETPGAVLPMEPNLGP